MPFGRSVLSLIKIEDIAHVRFAAPDLDEMERFLVAFGLTTNRRSENLLFAAGAGGAPVLHVTEKGEARFVAIGFRAETLADLEKLAAREGAAVEALDWPGSGKVVRLTDPDGILVEVVAGQTGRPVSEIPQDPPRNTAAARPRQRKPLRLTAGPSTVIRLGHAVLEVSDFRRSEAWYKERFGFITSDEVEAAPGVALGAFMRCDRGTPPPTTIPFSSFSHPGPRPSTMRPSRWPIPTTFAWGTTTWPGTAAPRPGGLAGTFWAARSSTTGRTPSAMSWSTGPMATCSRPPTGRTRRRSRTC